MSDILIFELFDVLLIIRGYLSFHQFENPKTFYVSNCNSTKKSFWNAHLEMPLFLNMPPKAAFLQKEVLPKDFKNFFQQLSYPFQGLPTKIMITGSTIIIRIMIEDTVFIVLLKHRCQASQPSIAAKHRHHGCEQNNKNYTYSEMSDISIFKLL